jgi:hypothetical protein
MKKTQFTEAQIVSTLKKQEAGRFTMLRGLINLWGMFRPLSLKNILTL